MKKLLWVLLGSLVLTACHGSALQDTRLEVVEAPEDTVLPDLGGADMVADLQVENDLMPDVGDQTSPDTVTACEEGEGCFGDPCSENDQCLSGWCVNHLGDGVCTQTCQEDCPDGWSCQQVSGSDRDVIYICVSDFPSLCMPCAEASDCAGMGGTQAPCLSHGPGEGSFCGGGCGEKGVCPEGFVCESATTVEGASLQQCVPADGTCECSKTSIALGLSTPCSFENEEGACLGLRICVQEGLTDCDAAMPAEESCDGLDNDCDGEVDEDTCDDGNPCTADQCLGAEGCEFVALDGDECLDGDLCTTGDHCQDGTCVGVGVVCDDLDPCTDDLCDPETGDCQFDFNTASCDDGDPCTVADLCQEGLCVGVPVDCECLTDEDCGKLEDGDLCNGTLFCNQQTFPHACDVIPETIIECPPPEGADAPCLVPACDPETGDCGFAEANEGFPCANDDLCSVGDLCEKGECMSGVAANCNDGNPCTDDLCEPSVGCQNLPNNLPCEDGDICTVEDHCVQGECEHGPQMDCSDGNVCTDDGCLPESGCIHTPNQVPCDDLNACTEPGLCDGGICAPGKAVDCDDGSLCTDDSCDPLSGCQYAFNSAPCSDGNPCTEADTCLQGLCLGQALDCDDDDLCTDDSCDPLSGCLFTPNTAPCNDGNQCTFNDVCGGGTCLPGEPVNCNDGNPCTDDGCDPAAGCENTPNTASCDDGDLCTTADLCSGGVCMGTGELACDDGNPCTLDVCYGSEGCVHTDAAGPCDDGNLCTVGEACLGGQCLGGEAEDCDDQNPCTTDSCAPATGCVSLPNVLPCDDGDQCTIGDLCADGECAGVVINCDDGNPCTDDLCHASSGCQYFPNMGPCDDQNTCTTGDICSGGVCVGVGSLDCDDGNPCTKDICEPGGGCTYEDAAGACDDGDPCTVNDACDQGACVSGPEMNCDDHNPCTEDTCVEGMCAQEPVPGTCSDGNQCTTGDTCVDGACVFSELLDCDDDNPCTADWCSPLEGCEHQDLTVACSDGDACTVGEVCAGGTCQGGAPLICDDSNSCTDDSCDPMAGCVFAPNSLACDDGSQCSTGDQCAAGLCVGIGILDCDDGLLCTTDLCDPVVGCQHLDNTNPCNDGDLCTVGDVCGGGTCQSGVALDCDDGNPCTSDACEPDLGCVHGWLSGSCEDGNVCTTGDICIQGTCQAGAGIDCVDDNPCTDDSCDPVTGCLFTPNSGTCNDGDLCTTDDACVAGACVPGVPLNCEDGDLCTTDTCDPDVGCVHVTLVPEVTQSCVELLALCPSLTSGVYEIDPDGSGALPAMDLYCDMTTDGGGWTGFTSAQVYQHLSAVMTCPDGASTEGIDGLGRPYTRDGSEGHTCHYTFDVPFGFSAFYLQDYKARANAGSGYTSDLSWEAYWKMTLWTKAFISGGRGDIGFGIPSQAGPVASFSRELLSQISCKNCEIPWPSPGDTWLVGGTATSFRIGWGEHGSQHEGWYPWWEGRIMFR